MVGWAWGGVGGSKRKGKDEKNRGINGGHGGRGGVGGIIEGKSKCWDVSGKKQ